MPFELSLLVITQNVEHLWKRQVDIAHINTWSKSDRKIKTCQDIYKYLTNCWEKCRGNLNLLPTKQMLPSHKGHYYIDTLQPLSQGDRHL